MDIYILSAGPTIVYGEGNLIKKNSVGGSSVYTVRKAGLVSGNELPLSVTWCGRKDCARKGKPIFSQLHKKRWDYLHARECCPFNLLVLRPHGCCVLDVQNFQQNMLLNTVEQHISVVNVAVRKLTNSVLNRRNCLAEIEEMLTRMLAFISIFFK